MNLWRQSVPLVLVAMAFLAWFEEFLPGSDWIAENLGSDFVIRIVLGILCLWVLVQEAARRHMQESFLQLITALRGFQASMAGGGEGAGSAEKRQAVEILIEALGSGDPKVRATSVEHLARITGVNLGEDTAAWRDWAQRNLGADNSGE